MNNYIDFIDALNKRISALENDAAGMNAQISSIIDGVTIKERYENRKNNKELLHELSADLGSVQAEKNILQLAKKIAIEMHAKQAANRFIKALKDNTKNLINTPDHYKKYKAAAAAALNENDAFITSEYHRIELVFQYYSIIGRYELTVLWTEAPGIISPVDVEKTTYYDLIPVDHIEQIARNAVQDAEKIDNIKKAAAEKIDNIKKIYENISSVSWEV